MTPAALLSPKVIGPIVVAALLFGTGWIARGQVAAASIATLKADHATKLAASEKKAREAVEQARTREAELVEQTRTIVDEARQAIQTLDRSIAASDTASRGMLDAARRTAGRCPPSANPAASIGSPGASMPSSRDDGERLMRLVTELDGFAGAAAQDADRSRAARDACQRSYEAAMKAVNQ